MNYTNNTEDLSLVQAVDSEIQDALAPPEFTSAVSETSNEAPTPVSAEAPMPPPVPVDPTPAPPPTEATPPPDPKPSLFKSFLGPPGIN